ncbi:MAG TPA: hypothetical protein VHE34_09040 [Puia sp.]|nr:hypothetical protein [Puia sp.]HVU95357.1 hypothetical protein [Puia sp.]
MSSFIALLKTTGGGWVAGEGNNWYRNDSLMELLRPYLPADAR